MNSITLVGKIRGSLDAKTRLVEVNRPSGDSNIDPISIPLRHWTREEKTLLSTLKDGTVVIVRGRLDHDNKIGLYAVAEHISIIK